MAFEALGGDYEVVFNGVEIDKFRDAEAAPSEGATIAYVGRHEPRKGLETLLKSVESLPANVTVWICLMALKQANCRPNTEVRTYTLARPSQ